MLTALVAHNEIEAVNLTALGASNDDKAPKVLTWGPSY